MIVMGESRGQSPKDIVQETNSSKPQEQWHGQLRLGQFQVETEDNQSKLGDEGIGSSHVPYAKEYGGKTV